MDGSLSLSPRERLILAAEGKGDRAIGEELGLSAHTVGEYMERVKVKLKAGSRIEAIALAVKIGHEIVGLLGSVFIRS